MRFFKKYVRPWLPKEIDRHQMTLRFLSGGHWNHGIDVGGRRSVLLDKLAVDRKYILDFHNAADPKFSGDTLYHNLEHGLPKPEGTGGWDLVIANDVIEHVENKQRLVDDIFGNCRGDVVISLPNTQHFIYLKGLFRGGMSKQFVFDVEDGMDRHRWITYYDDNKAWLNRKAAEHGFDLVDYDEGWRTDGALHLLLLFLRDRRKYFVFNQVFHFRKRG
ncbi:hypothetical protein [Sagittula salina]|uniref:Uncharacterized protein n=1 Tax=Sagittula salina TaxID=2820268 RepID=A0A940MP40_9RHOB|nr:hypothetical protein [Sagittula salina]MBP0485051.1 hypothetical protein [Sagittula salina]